MLGNAAFDKYEETRVGWGVRDEVLFTKAIAEANAEEMEVETSFVNPQDGVLVDPCGLEEVICVDETIEEESIEDKIRKEFGEVGVAVFKAESGLNPSKHSETDLMNDGRPFSVGLAQLNLSVHKIGGIDCTKAFKGKNYKAVVVDEALYAKCVSLASDPDITLEKVRELHSRRGFGDWSAYNSGAYKRHL
jgi:hypothetical protein